MSAAYGFEPTWSILAAAADYGNANLKLPKTMGFKIDALQDMDKAKLMYLMHHEGEGAGPAFITNTLANLRGGVDGLRKKFEAQIGPTSVERALKEAGSDVEIAYRNWLATYVDGKFTEAAKFFCSSPVDSNSLSDLFVSVGGKKLRAID